MSLLIQCVIGVLACVCFGWWIINQSTASEARVSSQDDQIEPHNSYQIGYLMGVSGGTVADAAVVRQALKRFEQTQGYKPTLRDAAEVVGLMQMENHESGDPGG